MFLHGFEALHIDVQALNFVAHVLVENPDHSEHACVSNTATHLIKLGFCKLIIEG